MGSLLSLLPPPLRMGHSAHENGSISYGGAVVAQKSDGKTRPVTLIGRIPAWCASHLQCTECSVQCTVCSVHYTRTLCSGFLHEESSLWLCCKTATTEETQPCLHLDPKEAQRCLLALPSSCCFGQLMVARTIATLHLQPRPLLASSQVEMEEAIWLAVCLQAWFPSPSTLQQITGPRWALQPQSTGGLTPGED